MKTNIQRGDKLLIVYRLKSGIDIRTAICYDLDYKGNGLVTYTSWRPDHNPAGYLASGSGAFDPKKLNSKKFGIISVINLSEVIS